MGTDIEKISFTKERATALLTLLARARQSRSESPVLDDPWAEHAVTLIDCEFDRSAGSSWRERLIAARAKQFDTWTRDFIAKHPQATVLHLGCGLDSRVYRVDPPASVQWFDIDYPDMIELRRRLYRERYGYQTIGTPLGDPAWLDRVPKGNVALIIAEGVTPYLTREVLSSCFNALVDRFSSGAFIFDVHSRRLIWWLATTRSDVRGTGARLHWGMNRLADVQQLEPRLVAVSCVRSSALARAIGLPWNKRVLLRLLGAMTCLRYRF
ncbi:MAG TPA: class I SAM-dependent methyltransferase [Gemmatimonadaceae bacterium]